MSQTGANPGEPRDGAIDKAYRETAREAPPRVLDDRILAAAHRAVGARPAPARPDWTRRWRVPLSIAATVILSATITLLVYETEEAPPSQPRSDRATEPAPAARNAAPEPEAQTAPQRREARPREPAAAGGVAPSAPSPVPSAAEERKQQSAPAQERDSLRDQSVPLAKERAPAAPASAAPKPEAMPAPQPQAMPAPRPVPPSEAPGKLEAAPAAPPAGAAVSVPTPQRVTPEDWVAEIRRLKREGRDAEAATLLTELTKRFPDFVLPDDLR